LSCRWTDVGRGPPNDKTQPARKRTSWAGTLPIPEILTHFAQNRKLSRVVVV